LFSADHLPQDALINGNPLFHYKLLHSF